MMCTATMCMRTHHNLFYMGNDQSAAQFASKILCIVEKKHGLL